VKRGIAYAFIVYLIWGLSPIFWKLIQEVPSTQIVSHRIVWSFLMVLMVVWAGKDGWTLIRTILDPRAISIYLLAAALLALNWLVYIWAVNSGFIVDASLGYFINPLVSVLLGVIFLKERLRPWQWVSVSLAGLGVLYLALSYGAAPWIGLTLAFSFGFYGFIRKKTRLRSLYGFTLETGFMFLPALVYILYQESNGASAFVGGSVSQTLLLVLTGVFTAVPLVLFGAAAQRIKLSTMGFIQYIAPTLQFLIGVLIYGEAFSQERLIGFGVIWIALAVFSVEGVVEGRNGKRVVLSS
jgi:chloramphenicol-sensitive protein RarD